ncbi:kettin homolog [Symsagittifera roscoffensis]|uniref:kettin homolog n=1 Tax=Symsagittifera roscoffensis TaxID=84072 RepID=UPI00307BEB24
MSSFNTTTTTTQHRYDTLASELSSQKHYIVHQTYEPHNHFSSHMDPPFVVDQLRSTVVDEGQTASFRVRVIGRPQPKIVWMKDERPIDFSKDGRITQEMHGDVYKLIIKGVKSTHRGIYAISAENDFGKALNSADLDITSCRAVSNPGAPRLSSGLADTELVVGQTVVLKCVIEGNPTPRVNWFKDNLMIMVTPRHKIQHKGSEFSLMIEQFSSVDVGVYKCQASNQHGQVTSSASVGLARDSGDKRYLLTPAANVFTSTTEQNTEMYARSNSAEEQTKVLERLKGKMIHEGKPLALSCRIHVSPPPVSFYWEKDGHLLEDDGENIMIKRKNEYQSLYIPNVTVDHGGIYRCTGESSIGSKAVTAAEIIVKPDLGQGGTPLSSRANSYARLYRPNSQMSLKSSMLNGSAQELNRLNLTNSRMGSQEALSIKEEEDERELNQDEDYVTRSVVTTQNQSTHESYLMHQSKNTSGAGSRSTASLYSAAYGDGGSQSYTHQSQLDTDSLHYRSASAISNASSKYHGGSGLDSTEADIEKMERLILNKQPPQLSSSAQLSTSDGLRVGGRGYGGMGGSSSRGSSYMDLRGSSARLHSTDNMTSPGTDPTDIDKQVLMPQKVVIPVRYYDARASNPDENTLERKERQVKTENVRKMVLSQTLRESGSVENFEERANLVEQQAKIGQMASKFGQHIAYQRPIQSSSYSSTTTTGVSSSSSHSIVGVHRT